MKKNMSSKRKYLFKAITWNLLAVKATFVVLMMLPLFFEL